MIYLYSVDGQGFHTERATPGDANGAFSSGTVDDTSTVSRLGNEAIAEVQELSVPTAVNWKLTQWKMDQKQNLCKL